MVGELWNWIIFLNLKTSLVIAPLPPIVIMTHYVRKSICDSPLTFIIQKPKLEHKLETSNELKNLEALRIYWLRNICNQSMQEWRHQILNFVKTKKFIYRRTGSFMLNEKFAYWKFQKLTNWRTFAFKM